MVMRGQPAWGVWVALLWGAAGVACGQAGSRAELSIACGGVGTQLELCREGIASWSASTGHSVALVSTPNSATERLALFQQLLAARSTDIDVFQIDVVWPGILGPHFVDLNPALGEEVRAEHFEEIVANNTVRGRLVAVPWFTDAGVLYYRRDLLERHGRRVPETWEELTETARLIQAAERARGNERLWGFVWQGRSYEGLTCDALEWVVSFGGGRIVAEDGTITINNPRARRAIETAAGWVGTISPPGVLNYAEEDARGAFQSGQAVFMRNWPYAWVTAQGEGSPVRGKVGVAPLPRGGPDGRHAATLGGWQLAVSRYSRQDALAVDLVRHLASRSEQKRRARVGGLLPTIVSLYDDPELLAARPLMADLRDVLVNAVARPSRVTGVKYNQVSFRFWSAVHETLSGARDAASSLERLEADLQQLRRGARW